MATKFSRLPGKHDLEQVVDFACLSTETAGHKIESTIRAIQPGSPSSSTNFPDSAAPFATQVTQETEHIPTVATFTPSSDSIDGKRHSESTRSLSNPQPPTHRQDAALG